eukprot:COSAG01_NODE_35677_length_528_cov_1.177156_2_plen_35_part_01
MCIVPRQCSTLVRVRKHLPGCVAGILVVHPDLKLH